MIYDLEYYKQDTIIEISKKLDKLKGMILLDEYEELFVFNDYLIESITYKTGFFKKKEVTEYYIKWIKVQSKGKEVVYDNPLICSIHGVNTLIEYYRRWIKLQNKLIKFTVDTGIPLNFSMKNRTKNDK